MRFGDYLREQREQRSWTQPEAARRIGIEQSYLSKLETGKSYPSADVFEQLADAYDLNIGEMIDAFPDDELRKLQELREVRTAILVRDKDKQRITRGWLVAALICALASGASFGLYLLGDDSEEDRYQYSSLGVLMPDEPLNAFSIVYDIATYSDEARQSEFDARKQAMTERLDQDFITRSQGMGGDLVIEADEGRRIYELINSETVIHQSPLRWLLAPAIMFLFGAVGSGLLARFWP